jgi:hypothetical protein
VVVGDALLWQAHLLPGPGPLLRTELQTGRSQTVIPLLIAPASLALVAARTAVATDRTHACWIEADELRRVAPPAAP